MSRSSKPIPHRVDGQLACARLAGQVFAEGAHGRRAGASGLLLVSGQQKKGQFPTLSGNTLGCFQHMKKAQGSFAPSAGPPFPPALAGELRLAASTAAMMIFFITRLSLRDWR
jgi:hypothetical protein